MIKLSGSRILLTKTAAAGCLLLAAMLFFTAGPSLAASAADSQKAVVGLRDAGYTSGAHGLAGVEPVGGPRTLTENLLPTDTSDIGLAAFGSYFYRLEKMNRDNISKFSLDAPDTVIWQYSTIDAGEAVSSNPHSLVFAAPNKAFVIRYGSAKAWIVNPMAAAETQFKIGELDLSSYADGDGIPEMENAVMAGGKLFVILQRLENWVPSNTSYVAVFDAATGQEIDTGITNADGVKGIPLPGRNPTSIQYLADNNTVYVACTGSYPGYGNPEYEYTGGIVTIDPDTYEARMLVDDGTADSHPYGAITGLALVSATKGYLVGYAGWGDNSVYSFNPSTGVVADKALPGLSHKTISAPPVIYEKDVMPRAAVPGLEHMNISGMQSGIYKDKNGLVWVCASTFTSNELVVLNPADDSIDETMTLELTPMEVSFCPTAEAWTDSDGDGIMDDQDLSPSDAAVATPSSATGTGLITIEAAGGALANVQALTADDASLNQDNRPEGAQFPHGVVGFTVTGLAAGQGINVTLTFPQTLDSEAVYYKIGSNGFYEYDQAVISGNTVVLTLVDGGAGDADGLSNGVIVDPGAVTIPDNTSTPSSGGGGGGGCFVNSLSD